MVPDVGRVSGLRGLAASFVLLSCQGLAFGQQPLLQMHLDATEVSGVTNGSVVTPSLAPPGFTGTVVVASGGSVNFAPAQLGNGVYFLNCCATNTAYYRFNGAAIGNIFNINQGQISFYLKSRYNLANRPTGARVVFDVRDGDPNNHLFHFVTDVATVGSERYLLFRYRVGNTAIPATTYVDYFFYVDARRGGYVVRQRRST